MRSAMTAADAVAAIQDGASAENLLRVDDICGDLVRLMASNFEKATDEVSSSAIAERLGQRPMLAAVGRLLSRLLELSEEDDSLLYAATFVSSRCMVYSERACDLCGEALIHPLFHIVMGDHDSDIRQLAAAALTALDANGRLHSDLTTKEKLAAFAAKVELLLEGAAHIDFQRHLMFLLQQCAKSGNTYCRERLKVHLHTDTFSRTSFEP